MFKLKTKEENVVGVNKLDILENHMQSVIEGKATLLNTDIKEYDGLVNKINELVTNQTDSSDEIVRKITDVLNQVTAMTHVKRMVQGVNKQTNIIEAVAASCQEMAASIEDVSNFVQESSTHASDAIDQTNTNVNIIKGALSDSVKAAEDFNDIKMQMDTVNSEMNSITEMVSIIKGIADQTNLLALNASIEAARAGESGRGFAVVADEIKKLADTTKESVSFIEDVTHRLSDSMNKTVMQIDLSDIQFKDSNQQLNDAVGSLSGIVESVGNIGDNMMQISANIEEQTAASEEVASSMMQLLEGSKELQEECDRTGRGLFELSQNIDKLRLYAWDNLKEHKPLSSIEICVTDHLIWTWRVYNMVLGYSNINPNSVGNHKECRLGKWLETLDKTDKQLTPILTTMEPPHSALHVCAKEAAIAYNNGNAQLAESKLAEMTRYSDQVIQSLDKLKRVLK